MTDLLREKKILHLGMPSGSNYGWGVCGSYLRKELSKNIEVTDPTAWDSVTWNQKINGVCLHALEGANLKPWIPLKGDKTLGYVFFENVLTSDSKKNSEGLDLIFGGSTWCCDRMKEAGVKHTDLLIQGIDPELFYPLEGKQEADEFVIFSGGKFEFRKGQDLVLAAFKALSQKYPNWKLIASWENQWPASFQTMSLSRKIDFIDLGSTWQEKMHSICARNQIDPRKVHFCPLLPNRKMRSIYAKTDLGVFPNRCEGGTNLVLMEYMACGRPVVASFSSGHKDILNHENSILVNNLKSLEIKVEGGGISAYWDDPDLDELIAKMEWAYLNRKALSQISERAALDMKKTTWKAMSDRVLGFL